MTINAYSARLDEIASQEARKAAQSQTAPWWVDYLIGSILAVMAWLFFVGC